MGSEQPNEFAKLLAEARSGSQDALGELLGRYRGYLWVIANDRIGDDLKAKVAASDVVQETFVATHRGFADFRGTSEEELKSWLRRSLINSVCDSARMFNGNLKRDINREQATRKGDSGLNRSALSGVAGRVKTPSADMMRQEQLAELQVALSELPADQRQIVVRRSIQKESFASIGESIGRSPDAVRMVWRRAFRKIFEQMTSQNV